MNFLLAIKRSLRSRVPEQRYSVLLVPDGHEGDVQRMGFRLSTVTGLVRGYVVAVGVLAVATLMLAGTLLLTESPHALRGANAELQARIAVVQRSVDEAEAVRARLRGQVERVVQLVQKDSRARPVGIGPLSEVDLRSTLSSGVAVALPARALPREEIAQRSLSGLPLDVQVNADAPNRLREEHNPGRLARHARDARAQALSAPSGKPTDSWVVSPYGFRRAAWNGERSLHAGVDLFAPHGTAVEVTGPGTVVYAADAGPLGLLVAVDHGHGVVTRYAHLSRLSVAVGQSVRRGQVVGESGSTGLSSGPHLHYEVLVNGVPSDPSRFFDRTAF